MNNFLIIESGSTKCDWAFVLHEAVHHYSTAGINPITGAGLNQALQEELLKNLAQVDSIFFYGAGTNSDEAITTLKNFFHAASGKEYHLEIHSDLLASARAVLGQEEGIIAILGTGSNSGIYSQGIVKSFTPSLGYLISDEGSGNHIGKELLKAYFYGNMCAVDNKLFFENYSISRESVLHALYTEAQVAAFLASFSPFLKACTLELRTRILTKVFGEFVEIRIKNIPDFSKFAIHFTGSIAHHYKNELSQVLMYHGCKIGTVLAAPMQKLIEYHKSRENV